MDENKEQEIIIKIQKLKSNKLFDWTMKTLSKIFNLHNFIIIILVLTAMKKLTNKNIYVIITSFIIITFFKLNINRIRPYMANNKIQKLEQDYIDEQSFPSGHTFFSIILTHILYNNFNINLTFIPYLVGLSRIYLGVHYPSDIIGSFMLSKIISKLYIHKKDRY